MEIWLWMLMVASYGYGGSIGRVSGRTEIMDIELGNADLDSDIKTSGGTCPSSNMAEKSPTNEPLNGKTSCVNGKTCLNLDVLDFQARLPELSCLWPTLQCWKTMGPQIRIAGPP